MVLLAYLDFFEAYFQKKSQLNNNKFVNVLLNDSLKVCFTKKYIDFLEQQISNKDAFQNLITELSDTRRIILENTNSQTSLDGEFVEIALSAKIPMLFPIAVENKSFDSKITSLLTFIDNVKPLNRHSIILELLLNNNINISYQDFKSDSEIETFFETLFSIPKYITSVTIFDRDLNPKFLKKLKGKPIELYTYFPKKSMDFSYSIEKCKELKIDLGNKLKVFYTHNLRLLHERKIIFEDLILTIDNAHNNLTIQEPTWEILLVFNKNKAARWREKCVNFRIKHI